MATKTPLPIKLDVIMPDGITSHGQIHFSNEPDKVPYLTKLEITLLPDSIITAKCETEIGYLDLHEVDGTIFVEHVGSRFVLVPVDEDDNPIWGDE